MTLRTSLTWAFLDGPKMLEGAYQLKVYLKLMN
jgi:hypothetical protein